MNTVTYAVHVSICCRELCGIHVRIYCDMNTEVVLPSRNCLDNLILALCEGEKAGRWEEQ